MFFPKDQDWVDWGISHDAHKFFLLRWHELFDERTLDAWQVRSSNIKSIVREILDAVDVVDDVHSYHPNIKALIDEAIQVAHSDVIIKKWFPFVFDYLDNLNKLYESKIKNKEKLDLDGFRSLTTVILGNLDNYRDKLISYIDELIAAPPDSRFKKLLYSLSMQLGIEFKLFGYSISSLRDSLKILKDTAEPDFKKRYEKLIHAFSGTIYQYECYFFILFQSDPTYSPDNYQIIIRNDRPSKILSEEEQKFYGQDVGRSIVMLKIDALDSYSARYKAEEKLELFFAVSRLYQGSKINKIKHPLALIKNITKNECLCVSDDTTRLQYIKDTKKPNEDINRFAKLLNQLDSKDAGQLNASLQHHKLALSASTDEARLVNLWIALEALIRAGNGSIIRRISTYVSASETTHYIYRLLRALSIDMLPFWKANDTTALRSHLKLSNKYYLNINDLLTIFLDKKNGIIITKFLSLTAANTLLLFRVYRLWETMFQGPDVLFHYITKHKQALEWQILRIYRSRNHIIHQGACLAGSRQLIQHLHTYYIITINNLVYDLLTHPGWNIDDAFEHRLSVYQYFTSHLKNHIEKPIPQNAILNPVKLLFSEGPFAWQDTAS